MDTRINLYLLIDYENIYEKKKTYEDAIKLLEGIPSETLVNYISGFSTHLYLNENTEDSGKIQAAIVDKLLVRAGTEYQNRWIEVVNKEIVKGNAPLLIWEYSNLKFYDLIFKNHNSLPCRDLTEKEAQKVYDAYLIINSIINGMTNVESLEADTEHYKKHIEDLTIPSFIYQKDYASTLDFSNQVTRGIKLYEYLEQHPVYGNVMEAYYQDKSISGYKKIYRNLMVLFTELGIGTDKRKQLASLEVYARENLVDIDFINQFCINPVIGQYQEDESFGLIREHFLYKHNDYRYYILNVNFLIDQFYKAQIFTINNYFKSNNIDNNFLSAKAKEFMEEIYLQQVISSCFPNYIKFFNEGTANKRGEELCDAYVRNAKDICLIEFKDVLLNAKAKNLQDKEVLYAEFEKKFEKNQKGKPKGITQLVNAICQIIGDNIAFDSLPQLSEIEIYPVIIYTDFTFGVDGLNTLFKEKFLGKLQSLQTDGLKIHDITFISLSYFELHEDYLAKGLLNIYDMINQYHAHTKQADYELTPFEVFSRFFMRENIKDNFGLPKTYQELLKSIVTA